MPSDRLSDFGMYCNEGVCERLLSQGFTECTFGVGPWVGTARIVGVWVFFHPNGRIITLETPKEDDGVATRRGRPQEVSYTRDELNKFVADWQINLRKDRTPIDELLRTVRDHQPEL